MMTVGSQFRYQHRWRRPIQPRLDIIKTQDAATLRHIEGAIMKGHPIGHIEMAGNGIAFINPPIAVVITHGVDHTGGARTHKQRAFVPQRHRAGIGQLIGVDIDGKPGRQLYFTKPWLGRKRHADKDQPQKEKTNGSVHGGFLFFSPLHNL